MLTHVRSTLAQHRNNGTGQYGLKPITESPIVPFHSLIIDIPIVFLNEWSGNQYSDSPIEGKVMSLIVLVQKS
jgi:hypothetical protein